MCNQPKAINLSDYQPPEFLVDNIELTFDLDLTNTIVTSKLFLYKNPHYADKKTLVLNGEDLELKSIKLQDKILSDQDYSYKNHLLTIDEVPQNGIFCLETQVKIDPTANTQLSGLYKSRTMLSTQCEAEGFRRITFYPDRPDVLSKFTTTLIANKAKAPVLLSNGNLIASGDMENNKHFATWEDPFKKPSYLFALVAGDLACVEDKYTTMSNRNVALKMYVEPENKHKCEYALQSLKNAMQWDEQNYGREFDLDTYMIVAVSDFNMGAMENKGLNIFNTSAVLVDKKSSTDASYRRVESVVGHEYFHNWTGNRITCRDWFQLSLKEGFTVFREQSFCAAMNGEAVQRIEDVNFLRSIQFAEDAGALSHSVRPESYMEINNFYTTTIYEKGAEVIRMMSNLVGKETFRKATDLYFAKYDGMAVRVEELIGCVAEASGLDMQQFLLWYTQAGTPIVQASGKYDASTKSFTLKLKQNPPSNHLNNKPYVIPVAFGLVNRDGSQAQLVLDGKKLGSNTVLNLNANEQEFVFTDLDQAVEPSLLRNFSAPIKLHYDYSKNALAFLMANDSDEFNRWEAGQQLYLDNVNALIQDDNAKLDEQLAAALDKLFEQDITNPEILSFIFSLPSYAYVTQMQASISPRKTLLALRKLKSLIGKQFYTKWQNLYNRCNSELENIADFYKQIGWRKLKNLALSYLLYAQADKDLQLVKDLFADTSKGMTDRYIALNLLLEWADTATYNQALEEFKAQWQADQLVMDMWFSAQAGRIKAELSDIESLFNHELFNIKNPNRLRSVLIAFVNSPLNFHREDVSGYRFLVDKIIEVDRLNTQMSAALTKKIAEWQRYEEPFASLMRKELERLANSNPSVDVYEILDKSLNN